MPIFNFNKPRTPEDLVNEGINFAKDLFGEASGLYFQQEEYIPPPTSRAPRGMRLITVSSSKEAAESGNYFKFIMGFHGENPYIYEKETYQQTTPGFLPVNEPAEDTHFKYFSFAPGKNPSAVLNPIQHIFTLAAGSVLGNPGGMNDPQEIKRMNLEKRWRTSRAFGTEITSYGGRPVMVGGLPYAIKLNESSARELDDLMAGGPVIGIQNIRHKIFNAQGMAEERTRADASAGRVPGLPREIYGLDTISETHRLLRSVSIGLANADDTVSSLTNTPTKAAQIGKRPYNPAMIFTKNKAVDVPDSGDYRLQTAVMEKGDPIGRQLVMNTLVPTIGGEGSRASGSAHFQAPAGLMKTIRSFGPGAALEATFRSTLDMPIEGLSGPEDLFYTTQTGERKLRVSLDPRFTPEGLAKRNVIKSAATLRVAEVAGMQGEHLTKTALTTTTKQRHAAVEGTIFTLPIEWRDDPVNREFIEKTLIPALQQEGFTQIEYRATEAEKGRRAVSVGLNIRQGEPMALKNFAKVTNTPVSRGIMGLWRSSDTGVLTMESSADAVVPFKLPEGVVWSRFNVATRAEQKDMLYSIARDDLAIKKAINKYYGGLGENEPAVLSDIATAVGEKGAIPLLERMTGAILGRERVLRSVNRQGIPVIDEGVLAKQNKAYEKYGISRDYGFIPIGEFTGETKQQFIEGAVRNLVKYSPNKMTTAEAQRIVNSAYTFTPGKKLSDGTEIFQGFELQEVIKAKGVSFNPLAEMAGVAGEKNDEIAEIMSATGNADIVKFKNMTRREMSGTQAALFDLAAARSSTIRQEGRAGTYIHIGDEATNAARLTLNRQDFMSIVEQLSVNNPSSSDLLEGLRKELANKFGDEFGLEFTGAGGKKVYMPKIESAQRLDASTTEIITGEESEVRNESLARLPQKYINVAQAVAGGDELDVESAINSFMYTSNTYIKSANLDKTPFGIYSPYETNTLLKPGQLFLSREAQERYYKIMGGDEFNTAQFQKYLSLFTGGAVGVGGRQPYISQKPGDAYGSVAPFEIITEDSELGKRIAEQQRATGIRSQDLVLSPGQVGMLGDSDADKLSLYMAIGRAQGDQGEFINMLAPMSPEERTTYLKDLLQKQAPEVGEKAMEIMMGGAGPLALEKNPTLANQIGYLYELSGKTEPAGLWAKRPYHNLETLWEGAVRKASGQKSHAMGDTHNQLIRRLHAAGMALKLEPGAYLEAMTSIGTKHSQLAVDQVYESQVLVKILKGAFIGKSMAGGSAQIVFDKSSTLTGEADFINLPWNKTSDYNSLIGRIGSILIEKDDLSDTAISRLIGTVGETTGKRLTQKQSDRLARKQLRNWKSLEKDIEEMRAMGPIARAQRMNELVASGRVSGQSLLGVGLKTRLAEQYEGKLSSTDDDRIASAEEIRSIAAASGLDINAELLNPIITASRDIYDILKTDKNTGVGYWKDPGNFAASAMNWARQGMENQTVIQEWMRTWGAMHNLFYQPKEGGGVQLVSGDTGKVIDSDEALTQYQASLTGKPAVTDPNLDQNFNDPRLVQNAGGLSDAELLATAGTEGTPAGRAGRGMPRQAAGVPPQQPPNVPPTDTGAASMPRDRDAGINGSAFYVQEKTPSYAQVEHRAMGFSSAYQSFMKEGGGYDALVSFGTGARSIGLFGAASNKSTVIERYDTLMASGGQYARNMIPFYLRNNPQTSRALYQLREMKKQAPYLYELAGNTTFEGQLAGALMGRSESTRMLMEEETGMGRQLVGMMALLDENLPKERKHDLPEDQALYLAENEAFLNRTLAEQAHIKINSPYTKSNVAFNTMIELKKKEDTAFSEMEKFEIINELPYGDRVTSAYADFKSGLIDETELAKRVQALKTRLGENIGLSEKGVIPLINTLEQSHRASANASAEYGAFDEISSRAKFKSEGYALSEISKLVAAIKDVTNGTNDYIKTLKLTDKEMKEFQKSVKDGTEAQRVQQDIAENKRITARDAIREMMKKSGLVGEKMVSGTGVLTSQEREFAAKALGHGGMEQLRAYKEAEEELTQIEKEKAESDGKGIMGKAGSFLRKVAGGFGLMYMRSMANIITSAGEYGYEESVATNAGIQKALSGQWGIGHEGYNQEANLFGARALYGGGGKRALAVAEENLLREAPAVIDIGKSIFAGTGGLAATTWLGQALGVSAATLGPIAVGIGGAVAVGSSLLTAYGKVSDQTSYIASNYRNYAKYYGKEDLGIFEHTLFNRDAEPVSPSGVITPKPLINTGGMDMWEAILLGAGNVQEWFTGTKNEFQINLAENKRLGDLAAEAQFMVREGKAKDNQDALKKMGVSEGDRYALEKIFAYEFTTSNMPGVSQEGRIAAVNIWEGAGGTVYDKRYSTLEGIGRAYDLGVDLGGINQTFMTITGNQYAEDRTGLLTSLANANLTKLDLEKIQSIGEVGAKLGVGWSKAAFGKTPEELAAWLLGEEKEWDPYKREWVAKKLTPKAEALATAMAGENADVAGLFLQTQDMYRQAGLELEGLAPGLLQESDLTISAEDKDARIGQLTRKASGMAALSGWAQKTGKSTTDLKKFWGQLAETGSVQQQEQYLNVLNNPSTLNFGILVSQLSATDAAAWNAGTLKVAGVNIPQSALSFTGVDQLSGMVSGRPWGQASIAQPGMTAQTVANIIWQNAGGYKNAGGAAQSAINAMVEGFSVGGQTYYGEQGMQAWQNQFSYNQSMAQIGVQLKQIALSETFTTGKGLSAYGFEEGGGFWGIEDRSRELSRRQQEASFENQAWSIQQSEKRLNLSEKYYGQNLALQQQQRTMQRAWTQQDWAFQQNVRELQWGWKQEDFQENVRFMTGRDRRLAERQMKRDTIMHDLEGEHIEDQKDRQQSLWKLEDQRFDTDKRQHQETLKMQREEIAHDKQMFEQSKRFYAEEKKLQDESIRLQRAYYVEQQKLQRESAGISASAAKTQKDLNDAMLAYNDYAQKQKGYLELAATSMSTLQTAIENLTNAINGGGFNQPTTYNTSTHYYKDKLGNSRTLTINLDGREVGRYVLAQLE